MNRMFLYTVSVNIQFLNVAEKATEWSGAIHQITALPKNVLRDEILRVFLKMNEMTSPYEGYVPYMEAISCDTKEWSPMCCRKQQNHLNLCSCGKCTDKRTESTSYLRLFWQHPTSFEHYLSLANIVHKFTD
eukprot:830465_1